jgi:hypothetical protein
MSDFVKGGKGQQLHHRMVPNNYKGPAVDQATYIFALYAHYVCHRSSRSKKCSVQFSSAAVFVGVKGAASLT